MYKKRFTKDISGKDGTIGKAFAESRDLLLGSTSAEELRARVADVLSRSNVNTPKSRLVQLKLSSMSLDNGLMYVQNILFASMGMGTY